MLITGLKTVKMEVYPDAIIAVYDLHISVQKEKNKNVNNFNRQSIRLTPICRSFRLHFKLGWWNFNLKFWKFEKDAELGSHKVFIDGLTVKLDLTVF